MEDEGTNEVAAPPRRVLLISAGASHSVALLSKQALISAHLSFCLLIVVIVLNEVLYSVFRKSDGFMFCKLFRFCVVIHIYISLPQAEGPHLIISSFMWSQSIECFFYAVFDDPSLIWFSCTYVL